jgi:hypothetical protein
MNTRVIFAGILAAVVACGSSREANSARAQSGPPAGQAVGSLDQLLAPIALYPDTLLAQILMSASDPEGVTKLDQFVKANQHMKGTQLQDATLKAGFEASLVALALFPQVVARMAGDIQWTTMLGQAFTANKEAVFASIQKLRHQAQEVGTLKTTPQQEVSSQTTSGGDNVIIIEPANPQVIYVPQYNPEVVYTQAPVAVAPTVVTNTVIVQEDNSAEAAAAGIIGFTAGIAIGASMNNSYYYGPYGYRGGAYMYNDAWDDYYDHREDAREDYMDHREDMMEDRGDRREDVSEQRSDRTGTRQEQRTERTETRAENGTSAQRTQQAQQQRAQTQSATTQSQKSGRTGSTSARGYSSTGTSTATPSTATTSSQRAQQPRSGSSDAFSGYSSGGSQRASSSRGQSSRGSSRGGGGGRRR